MRQLSRFEMTASSRSQYYTIGVVAAVDEVIRIADEAHIRAIVSHMNALGPANWGKSMQLVKAIDRVKVLDFGLALRPQQAMAVTLRRSSRGCRLRATSSPTQLGVTRTFAGF